MGGSVPRVNNSPGRSGCLQLSIQYPTIRRWIRQSRWMTHVESLHVCQTHDEGLVLIKVAGQSWATVVFQTTIVDQDVVEDTRGTSWSILTEHWVETLDTVGVVAVVFVEHISQLRCFVSTD